jgi:hypothetical protein
MDEDLTGRTGDLIAGFAHFRDASMPAPSPELAALFAATATTPVASTPAAPPTPRRLPVYKRILAGIPSKVAAGALGALLAGSVGAGALTGTIALTSHEDDAPSVESTSVEAPEVEAPEVEDGTTVDEVDDSRANDAAAAADLAAVPVPTEVSEAAHTHDFDEACGNHGRYVSPFARYGEEPSCATDARSAAAGTDGTTEDTSTTDAATVEADTARQSGTSHASGGGHSSTGKGDKGARSKGGR